MTTSKTTRTPPADTTPPHAAPVNTPDGQTDGKGNPVSGIAPEDNSPPTANIAGHPINTTGLGANSVDGNNVGGRSVDAGVPDGVVDRLNEQKEKEAKDAGKS